MLLIFLKVLFSILVIFLAVAFFTLFERRILGFSHFRFGPNKVSYWGLLQPFSDALRLFSKLDVKSKDLNFLTYFIMPISGLFLSVFLWSIFPFSGFLFHSSYSFILFILVRGLSVYFLLYRGWVTSTKFSLLGSYRSSAQSVSYEVVIIICFLLIIFWWFSINIFSFLSSLLVSIFYLSVPLFICWLLSCVAECNRSPFDFSEGESELVSGFNTEYGAGLFSLIFLGEYSSIIFFSFVTSIIFFSFSLFLFFSIICFFYLWVRASFPRLRYDFLIIMGWKSLLIFILSLFFCSFLY